MKLLIWFIKKTEYLSALSIRLVYWTGKSRVPIHPKHLIQKSNEIWYKSLLNKKMIVLDVGCGSGQHSIKTAKYVKQVIGIDKDLRSLEIARQDAQNKKISNVEFKATELEKKIDIKSNYFDLAILFDVLEHINKRQFFLKEIKRSLKKGGKAIVVIPNNDTSWKRLQRKNGIVSFSDPDHKIEYSEKTIQQELKKAGFKIGQVKMVAFDTPWVGFIDLVGGISLSYYKKLADWKKRMAVKNPEDCAGFEIIAIKK